MVATEKTIVRPFTPDDYERLVAVGNAVWPDHPHTVSEVRRWDDKRDPKCRQARWIAEVGGATAAAAAYFQAEWMYNPRHFHMDLDVRPEWRGQGIGQALYETVLAAIAPFSATVLRSYTRADREHSVRFLEDRGFVEEERAWESRLDVTAFDFAPFAGAEDRIHACDVRIITLRELQRDPDWLRKLKDCTHEADQDIPMPEPVSDVSLERYAVMFEDNPNLLPDGYFVAVHAGEPVGVSALWKSEADDDLHTGLTGVRRAWRRKGIALALKLRAIAYAREQGVARIRTDNNSTNRPMLSINERLGFVKDPAWIGFRKDLAAE